MSLQDLTQQTSFNRIDNSRIDNSGVDRSDNASNGFRLLTGDREFSCIRNSALEASLLFNACETHIAHEFFIERRDALRPERRLMLSPYTSEDYRRMSAKLFLSFDHQAGFGISYRGELLSVFALAKGYSETIITSAIALGATEVSCFDINSRLPNLYRQHGFRETERTPWNNALAPEGWNCELLGTPDVIIMHLDKDKVKSNEQPVHTVR